VKAHKAEVVLIDNLTTMAHVEDENAASSFFPIMDLLMRLKTIGVAAIVVHHSGKTGGDYRGSSALATTFEVIMALLPVAGRLPEAGTGFVCKFSKFRAKPTNATAERQVELGDSGWTAAITENSTDERVLAALESGQFGSGKDIAKAIGVSNPTVTRAKDRLILRQRVTQKQWDGWLQIRKGYGKPELGEIAPEEHSDF
jgi:hypothetical protein